MKLTLPTRNTTWIAGNIALYTVKSISEEQCVSEFTNYFGDKKLVRTNLDSFYRGFIDLPWQKLKIKE